MDTLRVSQLAKLEEQLYKKSLVSLIKSQPFDVEQEIDEFAATLAAREAAGAAKGGLDEPVTHSQLKKQKRRRGCTKRRKSVKRSDSLQLSESTSSGDSGLDNHEDARKLDRAEEQFRARFEKDKYAIGLWHSLRTKLKTYLFFKHELNDMRHDIVRRQYT